MLGKSNKINRHIMSSVGGPKIVYISRICSSQGLSLSRITKPSLKIGTGSAIFWIYLGIFRDYGLKIISLGIKLFLFFKIES